MHESVLAVLMYLVDRHMQDELEVPVREDRLIDELRLAGFQDETIGRAFNWLAQLFQLRTDAHELDDQDETTRIFSKEECQRLDPKCRGFIMMLEQARILDAQTREMVIDRVMALAPERIDLSMVKWVVLMVLFSEPGRRDALVLMERLILKDVVGQTH